VVTNAGTQTATGVTVTDTLPPGVTFVSCVPTCDSSALPVLRWTNAVETAAGSPIDPAGFDPLGQATFIVAVMVDSPVLAGIDQLDNHATVADDGANGVDPTPSNNTANDLDVLAAAPDLAVTKSDGVPSVLPGQTLTYDVQFRNHGSQDASGVSVTDTLPTGVTFVSCSNTCDSSGAPIITWNVGALNVGQVVNAQLVVTVDDPIDPTARHFVNTVVIEDDGANGPDPTPADNSSTDDDTTGVDLAVTKTDGQTTAVPGAQVTYTIVVTNNGPSTLHSFQLVDTLPSVLQGVQFTPSAGAYDATSHTWDGFGDLAEGASLTMLVTATVDSSATGVMTNSVLVTTPPSVPDRDTSNNVDTDTDTLVPTATLVIDKQLVTTLTHGAIATYRISVRNDGPSAATDVSVTDTLPNTLAFVSGNGAGWICPPAGGQAVTCLLSAPLLPGETRSLDIIVTVNGDYGANITNQAVVSSPTSLSPNSVSTDDATASVSPRPRGGIPSTGTNSLELLLLGFALLAPGCLLIGIARRRARSELR
jgi:uncharacterized repeat protein (TIGR01451 family)